MMTRFMVLYRSTASAEEQMANTTAEQRQAGMQLWMEWMQKAGDAVVDFGQPFGQERFIPARTSDADHAGGYSLLQGASIEEIETLLRDHPHFHAPGASIEILEIRAMPGAATA